MRDRAPAALGLPWAEHIFGFVGCPPILAGVCRWLRGRLAESSDWELAVQRPRPPRRRWGAASVRFGHHHYQDHLPFLPHMTRMEVRSHTTRSPFRLERVRHLRSLTLLGVSMHDLGPLFAELPRMAELRDLRLEVEHLYYYTRGREAWDQFPPRLRTLVTNVPLHMEALPVRELRRVEITQKSVVLRRSGWHQIVRPRTWEVT